MRRSIRHGLLPLALALGPLSSPFLAAPPPGAAAGNEPPYSVTVSRLRCEYLVNPMGLDAALPRLEWILVGSSGTPRNIRQRAYEILVASSPAILARDQGDLWASGTVSSGETSQIAYAGAGLASRQACYWKVRVTDSLGRVSAWSEPASWEMGLRYPSDWTAKWITAPGLAPAAGAPASLSILRATYEALDGAGSRDVTDVVRRAVRDGTLSVAVENAALGGDPTPGHGKLLRVAYVLGGERREASALQSGTLSLPEAPEAVPILRREFTLRKPVARARAYVTALGLYELHINGRRVGDHLLAPDWTEYLKRVRYQVYDVTALVKDGDNAVAALLGDGWYCGHIGNGGFQSWGKAPALLAQLEVTYTDGSVERVVSDGSWKVHPSPITDSDLMRGEDYDARREIAGWDMPGLDMAAWRSASEGATAPPALDGQLDPPVRETGEIHPGAPTRLGSDSWVYDMGQNMAGLVRLNVTAQPGTVITLRHAEVLNPDGSLYTRNLRGAPSVDTYTCRGGGAEKWQPRFTFHGFRYVELSGLSQAPAGDAVTGIVIGTDLPRTGDFSCSDPEINRLQSNIVWTMRANYLSVPTDCPQRDERMGWMADGQIFMRTGTYNADIASFFSKWIVDQEDTQTPDGAFGDVSPAPAGRGHSNPGVPVWADAGVIAPWTLYLVYGDRRILEQHLASMKRWIEWCQIHSTGLIRDRDRGPDYGDWLSQGADTPKDLIGTAFFAYSTAIVSKACEATGDTRGAEHYQELFRQIKAAFIRRYVSGDGHVAGETQCGYDLALEFGLLPDDLRPKAALLLAQDVASHHFHVTTGFVGCGYLLQTLTSGGKLDTAYRLLLQDTFPSWLFLVRHGATTVWERWDGWTPEKGFQDPGMNSFNHCAFGSCGEWMYETVGGIDLDPDRPGFSHFLVRPRPGGGMTRAAASFDSIHGKIATSWGVGTNGFRLRVSVPVNTTATVVLPCGQDSPVREGGLPVTDRPEITRLGDAPGNASYLVGSGDYDFSCAMR